MQYTGLSEVTGDEPPTYGCVGTDDGIASYRTMQEGRAGYGPRERIRRSRCSMAFPTALDWARGPGGLDRSRRGFLGTADAMSAGIRGMRQFAVDRLGKG